MTSLAESGFLDEEVGYAAYLTDSRQAPIDVEFVLAYTPGPAVSLVMVGVRQPGKVWRMALQFVKTETDGDIRCKLGQYAPGTPLQVRFETVPLNQLVPKLAAGYIEAGQRARKMKEKQDLERMAEWADMFEFQVGDLGA